MSRRLNPADVTAWRARVERLVDGLPVDVLSAPAAALAALAAGGIKTLGDLRAADEETLMGVVGIGPHFAREVRAAEQAVRVWLNRA